MLKNKKLGWLMKFKTLALLAVVFISLGAWLLPRYHTVHYRLGDSIREFPVLAAFHNSMPSLIAIGDLSEHHTLWKEETDFEDGNMQQHVYFTTVEKGGKTHYEIKAVSTLYTVKAAYHIIDNQPQPIYQRVTGLVVWTQAFWITLALAVLILVIQVVLGLVRSSSMSPQQKKKLRRYQK